MSWTSPAPKPIEPLLTGADRPVLENALAVERAALLNICAGLSAEQLVARPIAVSNLSLLGLIRHLTLVDRTWFRERAAGQQLEPLYDLEKDLDIDFNDLDPAQAEDAVAALQSEWQLCDEAAAKLDFDSTFLRRGETMSLRVTYAHMISEYARHNGHADLLRESIDGVTER
jgi:uncharacterized damage-inducible protein DinB